MNYCNLKFFNSTADYNDNVQNYYTVGYTYNINEGPLTISLQKDNISDDYDVFLYYKQEEYLNLNTPQTIEGLSSLALYIVFNNTKKSFSFDLKNDSCGTVLSTNTFNYGTEQ